MNGIVDNGGRALLEIAVRRLSDSEDRVFSTWIDTGFTGELVLPSSIIAELALLQSATVNAVLADGSTVTMQTYTCFVQWFDRIRRIEVVASTGDFPLLGVGLLRGHELRIDYRSNAVLIG